jgi:2-polyprenyl-3-methyl-5-hydroxy-6-metoxy-1,4-benzoquinol methylase
MMEDLLGIPQDPRAAAACETAAAEWYGPRGRFARTIRKFAAETLLRHARGARALACGSLGAAMTEALVRRFREVVVVDGAESAPDASDPALARRVEFREGLIEEFEADRAYDAVVLAWVLEHAPEPRALLRRAQNWLAPDGIIHVIVPNAASLHRRLGQAMGLLSEVTDLSDADLAAGHRRVYAWPALRTEISCAGLRILAREGIFLKPLPSAQMGEWPSDLLHGLYSAGRDLPDLCSEIYVACAPVRR